MRGRHPAWWALVAIVTCAITNYTAYRKAKLETTAGYSSLVESVTALQKAFKEHVDADQKEADLQAEQMSSLLEQNSRFADWLKTHDRASSVRTVTKPVSRAATNLTPQTALVDPPRTIDLATEHYSKAVR